MCIKSSFHKLNLSKTKSSVIIEIETTALAVHRNKTAFEKEKLY